MVVPTDLQLQRAGIDGTGEPVRPVVLVAAAEQCPATEDGTRPEDADTATDEEGPPTEPAGYASGVRLLLHRGQFSLSSRDSR